MELFLLIILCCVTWAVPAMAIAQHFKCREERKRRLIEDTLSPSDKFRRKRYLAKNYGG